VALRQPLRAAVVLAAALAAAGCGSDTPRAAAPAPAPRAQAPARLPAVRTSEAERAQAAAAQRRAITQARRAASRAARRVAARRERSTRRTTARQVASAIARALGFPKATAEVPAGARSVDVRLSDADACRATPADVRTLTGALRAALPSLSAVRVSPAGCATGGTKAPSAPSAIGKVLFSHTGKGLFTSRQIRIPARPWRLEYSGQGDFLQILVTRADRLAARPVELRSKPAGARTIDVRGPVKLRVAGTGPWTVRVRAIPR